MQVAQQIGEEWKFIDHFPKSTVQFVVLHHPRGAPPPPITLGNPTQRICRRISQLRDVKPGPKVAPVLPEESMRMKDFEKAFGVGDKQEEERCEERSKERFETRDWSLSVGAW